MDVKAAVKLAKEYALDLFADENITNLGLEEIEFDGVEWIVTLGFSRPWDERRSHPLASLAETNLPHRSYKIVRIDDEEKQVKGVKHREVPS